MWSFDQCRGDNRAHRPALEVRVRLVGVDDAVLDLLAQPGNELRVIQHFLDGLAQRLALRASGWVARLSGLEARLLIMRRPSEPAVS